MQPPSPPKIIALSGSIGSGKSSALESFSTLGAATLSADAIAREVVAPGTPALQEIAQAFGADVLLPSGELDRSALGQKVFSSDEERKKLETITHPRIRSRSKEIIEELKAQSPPLIVYEIPLYFESGFDYPEIDLVVVVYVPREVAIQRVVDAGKLTAEEVEKRLDAQIDIEQKRSQADYVIENTGDIDALSRAVEEVYLELTNKS